MQTSVEFLDAMKQRLGVESDYALARELGEHPNRISNYRTGARLFDVAMCYRAAEILGVSPAFVVAVVEAERAKRTADRKVWQERARRYAAVATLLILSGFAGLESIDYSVDASIDGAGITRDAIHIMRQTHRLAGDGWLLCVLALALVIASVRAWRAILGDRRPIP